jgi:O-antigen/teichoic acid export membrane protein
MTESALAIAAEAEPPGNLSPVPRRRLAMNVSFLAGSQVITWTVTLLWTLIVPRALGPEGMGMVVTALAASGVLGAALSLGTRTYLVRTMTATPEESGRLAGTAMALRILLAIPGVAVMTLFVRLAHFDSTQTLLVGLATAGMLLSLLAEPIQASFQARERMEYIAFGTVFNTVGLSFGGIALVLIGFRATGLMAWSLMLSGLALALNLLWLRAFHSIDWRTSLWRLQSLLRASLVYAATSFFGMVYVWVGSVMLAALTPATTVGWFGASNRLFSTLMFVPTLVATAWLPRLVTAYGHGKGKLEREARWPLELVLIISLPVAAGTALIAGGVVNALYGPEYARSVPVLIILAACCVPMYFNIVAYQVLVAWNRPGVWNRVMVVGTIVNAVLNVVTIRYFQHQYGNGGIGAAVSLLVTELMMSAVGLAVLRGMLARGSAVRLGKAALATLGMSAVVLAVAGVGFVAQALIGALAFAGLAWLLRLPTAQEQDELRNVILGLASRIGLAKAAARWGKT